MANNRHRGRKDASHAPIVAELEKRGFVVFDTSGLKGLGFDIVVYQHACDFFACFGPEETNRSPHPSKWMAFEIKSPGREKKLTSAEVKAQARAPIPVVSCVSDVLKYF